MVELHSAASGWTGSGQVGRLLGSLSRTGQPTCFRRTAVGRHAFAVPEPATRLTMLSEFGALGA
jgi:hypothetical protein